MQVVTARWRAQQEPLCSRLYGTFVETFLPVTIRSSVRLSSLPDPVAPPEGEDLICFSHLRWYFVFQRPQHLLTRFARTRRVFFVEEPVFDVARPQLETVKDESGVIVVVPHLPAGQSRLQGEGQLRSLTDELIEAHGIDRRVLWYYTPMARAFTNHLPAAAVVYDCMDELSAFAGAPPELVEAERDLLHHADVVLTGGHSLYEAKQHLHTNVHAVPSSVDVAHFSRARQLTRDPEDQAPIPRPRLGFFGVIDERMDTELIAAVATARPDWHIVLIGPVVKIDLARLPRLSNVHYFGAKPYDALPEYIAGWSVALLPFARNDATRFISPTKTPEYLAAGKPVVSTSIRDVVRPYGQAGLARIADTPSAFVAAVAAALRDRPAEIAAQADAFLQQMSWDNTWRRVASLVVDATTRRAAYRAPART
jgi:glycosyltransferase involved in cell wall biosynthesis